MDVSRWVTLTYLFIVGIMFVILDKSLKWLWTSADFLTEHSIIGSHITLTTLIALAIAGGVTWWMYRKKEYYAYIGEIIIELKKVTWPPLSETKRSTLIVIIFSIALSLYLWMSDQVWKRVTDFILSGGA
ncbi:MAG: preprotein translocase subunit SecE [Bradymonadaceae bacterium]|nr:preprotein translocase subunit SecE [Lujinxingiaceae bacterium]